MMINNTIKPIAFYLPQYHEVKENSEWWGDGFTEWTNVRKAQPNFTGHYQPHVPCELGYYDLMNDYEIQSKQIEMAKKYGIFGFCYHHYWFSGRRILEKPLEKILQNPKLDFPFCVSWANENWTRRWDGKDHEILLAQNHSVESDSAFIDHLLPIFHDSRYIKVNGSPLILVYRIDLLTNSKVTVNEWRKKCIESGFSGAYICAVDFYNIQDPEVYGVDAFVEFPPHKLFDITCIPDKSPNITRSEFQGTIIDMNKLVGKAIMKKMPSYTYFRGVMPAWDNTARRQNNGHIFTNESPDLFKFWFNFVADQTKVLRNENERFVFINAWNEWGEGCHLEPDSKFKFGFLEAIRDVLFSQSDSNVVQDKVLNYVITQIPDLDCESKIFEVEKRYETSISWKITYPLRLLKKIIMLLIRKK